MAKAPKTVQANFGSQPSAAVGAGTGGIDQGWVDALDNLVSTRLPSEGGNLRGMCIGERLTEGMPTGEQVITVFVAKKEDAQNVPSDALFQRSIEFNGVEYPVDVQELVEVYANPTVAFSPKFGIETKVQCGSCIGNARTGDTGTLGCLVRTRKGGHLCMLSNNHVMGGSNTGLVSEIDDTGNFAPGKKGDEIQAPGRATLFPDKIPVGFLARFKEIRFDGGENTVDAALAYTSFQAASPDLHASFKITPQLQNDPFIGMLVRKEGARTGSTVGIVVGLYAALNVPYGGKAARFVRQLVILGVGSGPFSQPGDSGSLIIEHETKRPVGLLFAGGKSGDGRDYTFANYIVNVMNELEIEDILDKEIT